MVKGINMTLGDGKDYILPPLSLGTLEDMQDRIEALQAGGLDKDSVATMIDVAWASLKRNYPDMTRDVARELIDVGNMTDLFEAVMDVSGLKRKALELGEATGAAS